jgi:hypothetical protein
MHALFWKAVEQRDRVMNFCRAAAAGKEDLEKWGKFRA